jgi:gluconolactonase
MVLELTASFQVIDPRFRKLAFPYVHVEKLYTGCRWAEGPAWFAAGRYLVWSDIPNDRMLRWDETDGSVSVFRQPAMNSNGHTVDLQGRLVSCEHRSRCVSRTEVDGMRTVLADRYEGKRFNSPNDLVVKSDGSIWFTDPSYGIDSDYEGDAAPSEIGACNVYRIDPASGRVAIVASDFVQPNGLAFSPDESLLYIVDTGLTHNVDGPHHVRRFRVSADGSSI